MSAPRMPEFTVDTQPERIRQQRRELFPLLSPEEDARIAAETGRARRVVRHECGRAVLVGTRCWWCRMRWGRP